MSVLLHGDCLEHLKGLDNDSVDFIFCDLPYGQTSCAWDTIIPWEPFWKEILRVKKLHTPIFFTTTTKFGVELINNAPKKCPFRYDLVWVKSAPAGFLSAKKMPMRKHEMVYCFYEKLPLYDLSSHKHKFIKEVPTKRAGKDHIDNKGVVKNRSKTGMEITNKYDPPLPVSVVKEEDKYSNGTINSKTYDIPNKSKGGMYRSPSGQYDPPLPTSVVKEDKYCDEIINDNIIKDTKHGTNTYNTETGRKKPLKHTGSGAFGGEGPCYDPPLPTSVVKEEIYDNGNRKGGFGGEQKGLGTIYQDPALISSQDVHKKNGLKSLGYDPPLPVSVVKEEGQMVKDFTPNKNGNIYDCPDNQEFAGRNGAPRYDPPLPNSLLEIKSTRGKHSTEKPVALMEWLLKYYSKEGDVVLDPTMGSGSTGVACKNMNRNFIGIEKDPDIYEVAVNRIQ